MNFFILNGHEPEPCDDLLQWAQFMGDIDARIVQKSGFDNYYISTMFLGIGQGHDVERPLLFETMVFDDQGDPVVGMVQRADTWEEAEHNHEQAEARVREVVEIARQSFQP